LFGVAPNEVEAAALIDLALRRGINFMTPRLRIQTNRDSTATRSQLA